MLSESGSLFELKTRPCKTSACDRRVKLPYYFCYNCNEARKQILTGTCGCGRRIKPEYSSCYGCFNKEKPEGVVGENGIGCGSGVNLSETVNASPYEAKA